MLNKNLFNKGDVVAIALSGGKDSMCLFHLVLSCAKELDIEVKAINVEHGIRGEASKKDSLFVKECCDKLCVPLKSLAFDCVSYSKENGLSIEESARKFRYQNFLKLIQEGFCNKVATAHHISDNVETVLLNLFRGASPSGLKGIPESSYDGKIIRPMLNATRDEIDDYVLANNLSYVVDESNNSDEYSRNFLRLNVIPEIKKRFPEMEKAVNRFVGVLAEEDEFLSSKAKQALINNNGEVAVLCSAEPPIFARACVLAMKECGIVKDYEKAHIDGLVALRTAQNGKQISLLNGIVGVKEYDRIVFCKQNDTGLNSVEFCLGEFSFVGRNVFVELCDKAPDFKQVKSGELYFDLDKIPQGAFIRARSEGDVFTKFGGGTKNLGDYMTDKKVPLRFRDSVPVVADGGMVLIICGVEISNLVKITSDTKRIGKITLK